MEEYKVKSLKDTHLKWDFDIKFLNESPFNFSGLKKRWMWNEFCKVMCHPDPAIPDKIVTYEEYVVAENRKAIFQFTV